MSLHSHCRQKISLAVPTVCNKHNVERTMGILCDGRPSCIGLRLSITTTLMEFSRDVFLSGRITTPGLVNTVLLSDPVSTGQHTPFYIHIYNAHINTRTHISPHCRPSHSPVVTHCSLLHLSDLSIHLGMTWADYHLACLMRRPPFSTVVIDQLLQRTSRTKE